MECLNTWHTNNQQPTTNNQQSTTTTNKQQQQQQQQQQQEQEQEQEEEEEEEQAPVTSWPILHLNLKTVLSMYGEFGGCIHVWLFFRQRNG